MPGKIFISYRRLDAIKDARAIYERLTREFGQSEVFIDLDGIAPGEDFVELLERQLDDCAVLVVLIGKGWTSSRLADENDFVRIEIAAGLRRKIKVFPVLINGAEPPLSSDLPEELRPLVRRQAIVLDDRKFDADIAVLARAIRQATEATPKIVRPVAAAVRPAATEEPRQAAIDTRPTTGFAAGRRLIVVTLSIAAAAFVGISVYRSSSTSHPQAKPQDSTVLMEGARPDVADRTPDSKAPAGVAKSGRKKDESPSNAESTKPPTQESAPDVAVSGFTGTWVNTVPGDNAEVTVRQTGGTVEMTSNNGYTSVYQLRKRGDAFKRSLIAQDAKGGHDVANESDADLVQTTVATVEGDTLVFVTTSDYRRPYFSQPVHVETSERRFKRK